MNKEAIIKTANEIEAQLKLDMSFTKEVLESEIEMIEEGEAFTDTPELEIAALRYLIEKNFK